MSKIIEKSCFKRMLDDAVPGLIGNCFIHVWLLNNDEDVPVCVVCTDDDWELSVTGEDAEYKFNLILESDILTVDFLLKNGFTQYG